MLHLSSSITRRCKLCGVGIPRGQKKSFSDGLVFFFKITGLGLNSFFEGSTLFNMPTPEYEKLENSADNVEKAGADVGDNEETEYEGSPCLFT